MPRRLPVAVAVVLFLLAALPISAQVEPAEDQGAPAHVAVVQGSAVLERNGVGEPVAENLPLLQGDRLRTESGRVEVLLPDGSVLDLDRATTVDLLAGGLVRLMGGRMVFVLAVGPDGDIRRDYQVDTPAGSVRFTHAGEYRVSAQLSGGAPFLEVSVVRGRAVVDADGRSVPLSAGERAQASPGQGVAAVGSFNSALADAFLEWSELQRGQRVGTRSTAYLPPELQVYGGTFDRDGSWDQSADYGWVWYPRVEADWRPYYAGSWYPYSWGWTWVGGGAWSWPTHHYGRWGHATRGWFWIPAASWGPAWVSWGFSTDYVGWCPLGWNDGPVFGAGFGSGFAVGFRSAGLGWTVVPHRVFAGGRGYRVPSYAVRGEGLRAVERATFDARPSGPALPGDISRRPVGGGRVSPYDRAQVVAAQRVGGNPGWASPSRPIAAAGRAIPRGSADSGGGASLSAPRGIGRSPAQAGATAAAAPTRAASRASQAVGAGAPSRGYDPRAFASPSQPLPPYPGRYRPSDTTGARPASPYYYLGPTAPRTAPGTTDTAVPRSSSPAGGLERSPAAGDAVGARPRPYGAPPYEAPAAAPRQYSVPDRPSAARPGPSSSGSPAGTGARPTGSFRPSAPAVSGGRPGGTAPSGSLGGGRTPGRTAPSGGGPARGGRGR